MAYSSSKSKEIGAGDAPVKNALNVEPVANCKPFKENKKGK